jgi:hypothetical protein
MTCLRLRGCQAQTARMVLFPAEMPKQPASTLATGGKFHKMNYCTHNRSGFGGFGGFVLLSFLLFMGYQYLADYNSQRWPELTGKIVRTELTQESRRSGRYSSYTEYVPVVEYLYVVNHATHVGTSRLRGFRTQMEALNFLDGYRKGTHVQIHVDPHNSNASALAHG